MNFAKANGLGSAEVNAFLNDYENPKTLDDLAKIPNGLLNHYTYISDPDKAIYDFVKEEMYCDRYETIGLETIVDCLYDRFYDATGSDLGESKVDDFEGEERKDAEKLIAVRDALIKTKFGSVTYDW